MSEGIISKVIHKNLAAFLDLMIISFFFIIIFYIFFTHINLSKNLSAKYYQNNNERLQKKFSEKYHSLSEEYKEKKAKIQAGMI